MIEASLVSYKKYLIDYQVGSPGQVDFDFMKVWNFYKEHKAGFCFGSLQFFHVHPGMMLHESEMDKNCMEGFYQAFGQSTPFHIVVFKNRDIMNLDCAVLTLTWNPDLNDVEKCFKYDFKFQDRNFLILKLLAYGKFPDPDYKEVKKTMALFKEFTKGV